MTWTREKHLAAILIGIDPRVARAADSLLDAGLIVQVGERPNNTGKMMPIYQIIKTAENESKWIETLCALPSNVLDAFADDLDLHHPPGRVEDHTGGGKAMSMTNDKRLAVYMYFINRESMREGVEILKNLGYRYTEHPEVIDEADANTTFVEAWKPVPAGADEDTEATAAIHEINRAIGMLGSACEANIFDTDEQAYWWDDAHTR
jgi:hypothetical protein